jgi:hypothetical protein
MRRKKRVRGQCGHSCQKTPGKLAVTCKQPVPKQGYGRKDCNRRDTLFVVVQPLKAIRHIVGVKCFQESLYTPQQFREVFLCADDDTVMLPFGGKSV